jgi:microcystin degradation protein MlrC
VVGFSGRFALMLDRALYGMVGITRETVKVIVNKSAVHFQADFDAIASEVLYAKAAGPMAADPADLPWRNLDLSPAVAIL